MHIELCQLARESKYFQKEVGEAFERMSLNADFVLREETRNFESNFAKYIGTDYACGTKSGTSALFLGLLALWITSGDEVITTPLTFIATSEAIAHTGARPVYCDVKLQDGNIDEEKIEALITSKTKAILWVHLYGNPCNNEKILEICKKHGLFYVEDASHAHGVQDNGKKLWSFGDIACFSFMPAKVLWAYGDAGIVVTSHAHIHERIEQLRNHGRSSKHIHSFIGYNERIDNLQAGILDIKLKKLDEAIAKRREIAKRYVKDINFPVYCNASLLDSLNFFAYCIKCEKRDILAEKLQEKGISTGLYYPVALHLQPAFSYLGYKKWDFPHAEYISQTSLALPVHQLLEEEEIEYIIETLREFSDFIPLS